MDTSLCVYEEVEENNRVCLCGVGWMDGPSQGLYVGASLHCEGAVGPRGGYPPEE